jgi:hypothetical protein
MPPGNHGACFIDHGAQFLAAELFHGAFFWRNTNKFQQAVRQRVDNPDQGIEQGQ